MIGRKVSGIVKKKIIALLEREYGLPKREGLDDPLEELVLTLLSQNTNDRNRDRAWEAIRQAFPNWGRVVNAGTAHLAKVIRPGGLARVKAQRIIAILKDIKRKYGKYDLGFLRRMSRDEARSILLSFTGVGPKTAACVLLFSCGKPAFPVDTHIHRVASRLGLILPRTTREKAHEILEEIVPEDKYYSFHLNMIQHGRIVCKAQRPRCRECVLLPHCPYGKKPLKV